MTWRPRKKPGRPIRPTHFSSHVRQLLEFHSSAIQGEWAPAIPATMRRPTVLAASNDSTFLRRFGGVYAVSLYGEPAAAYVRCSEIDAWFVKSRMALIGRRARLFSRRYSVLESFGSPRSSPPVIYVFDVAAIVELFSQMSIVSYLNNIGFMFTHSHMPHVHIESTTQRTTQQANAIELQFSIAAAPVPIPAGPRRLIRMQDAQRTQTETTRSEVNVHVS